jgi:amicoumacin kinase
LEASVAEIFGEHIIDEAATRFGLTIGSQRKLGDFENYVFEMERNGAMYILRLTHSSHRAEADISAELSWISYLVSQGLVIPQCYLSLNGKMTELIAAGDSYFTACLFEKARGHLPDYKNPADWNVDLFRKWGELTGSMHQATSRYTVPEGVIRRLSWDDDDLLQNADRYIEPGDEYVLQRLNEVLAHLRKLPRGHDVFGLIHTDIHPRNFFVQDGQISVFDFDDCAYNWFIHDLAIPLYYSLTWVPFEEIDRMNEFAIEFVKAFWTGYRTAYELPSEWLNQMPYFMKLRDITLYLVLNKKTEPQDRTPRLLQWMEEMKDRIKRDVPIVELDYTSIAEREVNRA